MKEILDELIDFSGSYLQPDLLEKNREMFSQKKDQLDEKEKHVFLDYLLSFAKSNDVNILRCEIPRQCILSGISAIHSLTIPIHYVVDPADCYVSFPVC